VENLELNFQPFQGVLMRVELTLSLAEPGEDFALKVLYVIAKIVRGWSCARVQAG